MGSEGGTWMSFEELIAKYDIPCKHRFKYLQVKNFIRSSQNQYCSISPLSWEEVCAEAKTQTTSTRLKVE